MLAMAERESLTRADVFQRVRVNIAQACAIAGVCRRTMHYWIRANKVEYVVTPSGHKRIYVDSLLRPMPEE